MLPTRQGSNTQPTDHHSDRHPTEPPRPATLSCVMWTCAFGTDVNSKGPVQCAYLKSDHSFHCHVILKIILTRIRETGHMSSAMQKCAFGTSADSEGQNQPVHPCSLIWAFTVLSESLDHRLYQWITKVLIRLCGFASCSHMPHMPWRHIFLGAAHTEQIIFMQAHLNLCCSQSPEETSSQGAANIVCQLIVDWMNSPALHTGRFYFWFYVCQAMWFRYSENPC